MTGGSPKPAPLASKWNRPHIPGSMHHLIHFRFSHYNEKARWALDRAGVSYRETACMPLLHVPVVLAVTRGRFRGRGDAISSRYSTPVLLTDDGESFHDSSAIVQYVSRRFLTPETSLYPTPEAAALEKHFHDHLGSDTRRLAYLHLFAVPGAVARLAERNVGPAQAAVFKRLVPVFRYVVRTRLRVDAAHAATALARIREELVAVSERLGDGRPYLLGERFTAADLAFACMMAPALLVQTHEGFGGWLPSLDECGPDYAPLVREFRATPAGAFALRMFAEERRSARHDNVPGSDESLVKG